MAQAEKIRARAVVHNAELIDIIVDGGESAKSLQRPGMERQLALADDGQHLESDPAEQMALAEIWRLRSEGARRCAGSRQH